MKLIPLLFPLFSFFSANAQDSCTIKLLKFYRLSEKSVSEWKTDSQGCLKLRSKYVREIEKNIKIIGMPKDLFLEFFGQPNIINKDHVFAYFINANCKHDQKFSPQNTDIELIVVFFEDKVQSISLLIYE